MENLGRKRRVRIPETQGHIPCKVPEGIKRGGRSLMRRHSSFVLPVLLLAATAGLMWTSQDAYAQRRGGSTTAERSGGDRAALTKTIAVLGSSVARGWVTSYEARRDLLNGYAFRLERLAKPRGWKVVNISNPGDDTRAVLARIEQDLVPTGAGIVIIGLSMSNEGLEDAKNPKKVLNSYRNGLQKIIQICRKNGIAPVVGLCYPNDNYDAEHYSYIKQMNLLINSWDVPSINFLGPVDNGSGGWIEGYTFDLDHPDDVGHEEMFYAIVPSLFEAMAAGKPVPVPAKLSGHITVTGERDAPPISFIPEDVMHSFTVAFKVRPSSGGCIAALDGGDCHPYVEIANDGRLQYVSVAGRSIIAQKPATDGEWHAVVMTHRYLLGETELFLDGKSFGTVDERLVPRQFIIGGPGNSRDNLKAAAADYRELLIYRSPLNLEEVKALQEGDMLQASLEIYAPLNEGRLDVNTPLANLAQSLSRVVAYRPDVDKPVAELARKIDQAGKAKRYIDRNEKKPIEVDSAIFDAYVGEYQVDANLTLIVTKEKGRLLLSPNRTGKTQLFPESETKYFARIMGPKIGVTFVRGRDGKVNGLTFHQDGMKIPAKRVR